MKTVDVLESEKECEQKRMRQDNLKGGGPMGEKPKVPMKPNLGGTPVWFRAKPGLIQAYTLSGAHSAGPVDTLRGP